MSDTLAELKQKASQLSEAERADLALSLIESLDGPAEADVEAAWVKEAQRRHREVVEGKVQPIPGERVFANLRDRLKG